MLFIKTTSFGSRYTDILPLVLYISQPYSEFSPNQRGNSRVKSRIFRPQGHTIQFNSNSFLSILIFDSVLYRSTKRKRRRFGFGFLILWYVFTFRSVYVEMGYGCRFVYSCAVLADWKFGYTMGMGWCPTKAAFTF